MKYTRPRQATDVAIPNDTARSLLLTTPRSLTGVTIGDSMIEHLLDDAQREDNQRLTLACSKALRRVELCTTGQALARRQRARQLCAEEINSRAAHWARLRAPSWYQKYAQLLGVTAPARADDHFAWVSRLAHEESCDPSSIADTLDMDPSDE